MFDRWIVDDAGISFAYARNLAAGHGLVSQPGAVPVEGYSNFLWVLLMAPAFLLGVFHVVWTPKILATVLTVGSFFILTQMMARRLPHGPVAAMTALTLVALQPSFVIWSVSGLENPLYVFLLALLADGTARLLENSGSPRRVVVLLALAAAGIVATRPEGVIYLVLPLPVLAVCAWNAGRARPWLGATVLYCGVVALTVGGLVGFRWWYFADLFPNPYYAKGGPTLETLDSVFWLLPDTLLKLRGLAEAIAGVRGATWFVAIVLAGSIYLAATRQFRSIHSVLAIFAALSGVAYLLLPADWMGEYRFASPFFLFLYPYVVALAWSICPGLPSSSPFRRRVLVGLLALLLAGTLVHVSRRSVAFARHPTVSLHGVAERLGHRYNRLAIALGQSSASLLAPDMGGALLQSNLVVYDLGGLCDRTIARTLGRDQRAFHDYIFLRIRPTFIQMHHPWSTQSDLDGDERFRRDYLPIRERFVYRDSGWRLERGDYVRRDALRGSVADLAAILNQ
jgi:hypothetical protein